MGSEIEKKSLKHHLILPLMGLTHQLKSIHVIQTANFAIECIRNLDVITIKPNYIIMKKEADIVSYARAFLTV